MFKNPFVSIHDIVAEAKAEREQLDRLLDLSSPRENILVAITFLLLLTLAGWLVFGKLDRNVIAVGTVVGSTLPPDSSSQIAQTDVRISTKLYSTIHTGMLVELNPPDGLENSEKIMGTVQNLQTLNLDQPSDVATLRLEVTFDPNIDLVPYYNEDSPLIIHLKIQSPLEFFREFLL